MREHGGPAFPQALDCNHDYTGCEGMSLRDYFAAQALAYLTCANILQTAMTADECEAQIQNVAAFAYRVADAMLKERGKS